MGTVRFVWILTLNHTV
uniref:Uncharacterized protein n=1 Tax=Rhizophora mucronata TaxID=61149 RepID=A0A2P2PYK1_RHIMU